MLAGRIEGDYLDFQMAKLFGLDWRRGEYGRMTSFAAIIGYEHKHERERQASSSDKPAPTPGKKPRFRPIMT